MGKGLDHKKPGPIGRRRDGEGASLKEEQSVEGSGPPVEARNKTST